MGSTASTSSNRQRIWGQRQLCHPPPLGPQRDPTGANRPARSPPKSCGSQPSALPVPTRTGVELEALLAERVAAAPQPAVLLQHQHPPAHLGQQHGHRQPPNAAADDDGVELLRDFFWGENCGMGGREGGGLQYGVAPKMSSVQGRHGDGEHREWGSRGLLGERRDGAPREVWRGTSWGHHGGIYGDGGSGASLGRIGAGHPENPGEARGSRGISRMGVPGRSWGAVGSGGTGMGVRGWGYGDGGTCFQHRPTNRLIGDQRGRRAPGIDSEGVGAAGLNPAIHGEDDEEEGEKEEEGEHPVRLHGAAPPL